MFATNQTRKRTNVHHLVLGHDPKIEASTSLPRASVIVSPRARRDTYGTERIKGICDSTEGATDMTKSKAAFATMILTFRSSKVVAYWRRVISSK